MLKPPGKLLLSLVLLLAAGPRLPLHAAEQAPEQAPELAAKKTPDGVLFQCLAPDASVVYLAGDFNAWGNSSDGHIGNPQSRMDGPDKGIWHKVVKLEPGEHKFKFNLGGILTGWFAPEWAPERDADGNAVIQVAPHGEVLTRSPVNPDWKPQQAAGKVTFRYYAPSAQVVYFASDANEWASNQNGQVTNAKYAMDHPGADGVWHLEVPLTPGRHAYKFVVDGETWVLDPNAPEKDGEDHSIIVVK